jgi:N-hydroxyarylamine O-acetyltransferase
MRVDRYLERIGLERPIRPDLESLRAIHRAHLMSIAYENFDVQFGRPVTIDIPAIYEKIVENGRGGWCYEMNGIFGWALTELGFKVTRATGAVMREMGGAASEGNHLVLTVELDEGVYLADVGFGDGTLHPFAVRPGAFAANGFDFAVTRVDEHWWRFHNHRYSGAPSFDFNLAPADESLLAAKCDSLQRAPDSIFVQNLICFRHGDSGFVVLRGRVLREVTPEGVSERVLENADEFRSVIADVFALNVPDAGSLWPKICARHAELFPA